MRNKHFNQTYAKKDFLEYALAGLDREHLQIQFRCVDSSLFIMAYRRHIETRKNRMIIAMLYRLPCFDTRSSCSGESIIVDSCSR